MEPAFFKADVPPVQAWLTPISVSYTHLVEDYTKILTTNTEKPFSYISTPANETNMVICAPVGDSADRAFAFTVPDSHYWGWQGFPIVFS